MKRLKIQLVCLFVLCALVLGACQKPSPADPTPEETPNGTPSPDYCANRTWKPLDPAPPDGRAGLAVDDYVIVVGPGKELEDLRQTLSGAGTLSVDLSGKYGNEGTTRSMCPLANLAQKIDFGPLPELTTSDSIELPYLNELLGSCTAMPQHKTAWHDEIGIDPSLFPDWRMELWRVEDAEEWKKTVSQQWGLDESSFVPAAWVAAAANCQSAATYGVPLVFADPTYRTGRVAGNPWTGEGGPWTGEGGGVHDPAEAPTTFWSQWALQGEFGIGLNLTNQGAEGWTRSRDLPMGENVIVGVFDAEPFGEPGTKEINWITPPLSLTVEHMELLEPSTIPFDSPASNHGLYVAGLIHAVAPASDIYLYRVLDRELKGDLWALNLALNDFIQKVRQQPEEQKAKGAVINLSLGGRPPQDYWRFRWLGGIGDQFPFSGPSDDAELERAISELVFLEVASLKTLLSAAHCQDMVVVAAAGNDSYNDSQSAHGPRIPAIFDEFIAVEASDAAGARTCFSNRGDLAAPGGGSVGTAPCVYAEPAGEPCCKPALDECSEQADCPYGTVSLVLPCQEYASGYAYWAGTSFATPLVSGLAALVIEKYGPDPKTVSDRMTGNAQAADPNLAHGIIHVSNTLSGNGSD